MAYVEMLQMMGRRMRGGGLDYESSKIHGKTQQIRVCRKTTDSFNDITPVQHNKIRLQRDHDSLISVLKTSFDRPEQTLHWAAGLSQQS
jgi:hypothetical protein